MRHCDRVEEQKCAAERRDFEETTDGFEGNTTHYYTGYKGSLAWEYNVQCSSVDDSAPDVCACIASNNDLIFAEDAGGVVDEGGHSEGRPKRQRNI